MDSRSRYSIIWRILLSALVALALVSSACKTGRGKGGGVEDTPPIKAKSGAAQKRFDEAMAQLEAGRYDQARESFRLVQAEFSGDPIATLAELYVARASMGPIELGQSFGPEATSAYRGSPEAARILASLSRSDQVDKRIRYGAQAYHAVELALRGSQQEALAVLEDYPSASISNVVLDRDRPIARSLVAESLFRAGRNAEALEAAARLYEDVSSRPQEGSGPQEERDESLKSLAALARDHAFDAADSDLDAVALQDYLSAEFPLLRAAAGWALLSQQLRGGVDDDQRAALEDLFNRIAPDLVAVGAGERAAELSKRMAAVGGPQRLALGFLAPLSGPHRAIGQRAMAGALVAMRAFHHAGQPSVTLIFEDSEADPAEVFDRLASQEVLAVVGPMDVNRANAFAPLAREHQIPLITLTTEAAASGEGAPKSSDAAAEQDTGAEVDAAADNEPSAEPAPFVFRNFIDAAAEARAAARTAFDQIGDRKAAVVFPQVGYGQVTSKAFADEFRRLGGQIVAEIAYDRTKSDFANVARQLAKSGAESVFVPDSAQKVAELSAFFANENIWGIAPDQHRSKRAKRMQVHYLGTSLWEDPILVRQAASYVDGAAIPVWFSTAFADPQVQRFVQRFQAVYGRDPQNFEAFSYDTVAWLRSLMLERGMSRPVAIRDALVAGSRHDGVTGRVQMTRGGEPQREIRFVTPTSEGFEPLPFVAKTAEHTASTATDKPNSGDAEAAEQGASGDAETERQAPPTKLGGQ